MQTRRLFYTNADARLAVAPALDGRPTTLTGYALVWNTLSSDRGGYKVRLRKDSARFAVPTHALFHHDFSAVLGSTGNGTLRLSPDDYGVRAEIDVPDTTLGRDVAELVRRGDVRGMSFAMVDDPVATTVTEGGTKIVDATSFLVDEVTITAVPAFDEATVGVKPAAPPAAPIVAPSYANRIRHRNRLQLFRFEQIRPTAFQEPRR